ncbi:MAG: hypothetical protein AAGG44_14985, partial [Planctomycetota bacterium]
MASLKETICTFLSGKHMPGVPVQAGRLSLPWTPAQQLNSISSKWRSGTGLLRFAEWVTIFLVVLTLRGLGRAAEVDLPQVDPLHTIHVEADTYATVKRGVYDVIALEGQSSLRQGALTATADEIVLWIERNQVLNSEFPGKVLCYLNGNAKLDWGDGRGLEDHRWTGRLFSIHPVSIDRGQLVTRYDIPTLDWEREPQAFHLTQFSRPQDGGRVLMAPPLLAQTGPPRSPAAPQGQTSRVPSIGGVAWNPNAVAPSGTYQGNTGNSDLLPNGGLVIPDDGTQPFPAAGLVPEQIGTPQEILGGPNLNPQTLAPAFPQPNTVPNAQRVLQPAAPAPLAARAIEFMPAGPNQKVESAYSEERGEFSAIVRGGFKLTVRGVQARSADGSITEYGTVVLEADNAVMWTKSDGPVNIVELSSSPDRPIELYLEGNIVFAQGNRVIRADRMYYNVSSEYGMILSAEVLTPVPQYQGLLRLKADVLQQRDSRNFKAFGAAVTSSQMGIPRYWVQSREVDFTDNRSEDSISIFGEVDDKRPTGMEISARSNHVYLAGIPIFWWPTLKTDLREPTSYLSSIKFKNDTIFGFQTFAEWNAFELLGMRAPDGTRLRFSTDYLSDRGFALGYRLDYDRASTSLFGAPGYGVSDGWFINDSGTDFLGLGRTGLQPEEDLRGRVFSKHRFFFSPNFEVIAETGWISDRDFLEQYFEQEWEQDKDFTTALRARRYNSNRMFDLYGQARVNDFFTESEWLPRLDHYWIGQNLLGERLTWSAYNTVGYAHQRVATAPVDPGQAAQTTTLPWESDSEGIRAITRQELSMPFSMGAFKVVPFLSGEAGFWNEDVNGNDVTRLTGQAGVRSSLPMWSVNPNVDSRLFDLRGLAHKLTLESEF